MIGTPQQWLALVQQEVECILDPKDEYSEWNLLPELLRKHWITSATARRAVIQACAPGLEAQDERTRKIYNQAITIIKQH